MKKKPVFKFKKRVFLWLPFGLFLIGSVFLNIRFSLGGVRLRELEDEEGRLTDEKRQLTQRVNSLSSLVNLKNAADSLGFSEPKSVIYIGEEAGVAAAK